MFSFFRKKPPATADAPALTTPAAVPGPAPAAAAPAPRQGWLDKLRAGLRKTGGQITTVFTGTRIDEALYEELEAALLMADTGVAATTHLLDDLKRRVKEARATDPQAVKGLLADAIADLLAPLQKPLVIGEHRPTVIMVAGVNGAGKTTSIGKLTRHLSHRAPACCWLRPTPSARPHGSNWRSGPTATRWRSSPSRAATRRR